MLSGDLIFPVIMSAALPFYGRGVNCNLFRNQLPHEFLLHFFNKSYSNIVTFTFFSNRHKSQKGVLMSRAINFASQAEYRTLVYAVSILILSEIGIVLFTLACRIGS